MYLYLYMCTYLSLSLYFRSTSISRRRLDSILEAL